MLSELVISTYQKPDYLKLALSTLKQQTRMPDYLCIADDGSDERTAAVIDRFRNELSHLHVRHVWHEDAGFRKTRILNDCVRSSVADYQIYIDDDCLMHPRFIERHLHLASRKHFLTGSLIRLDEEISRALLTECEIRWTTRLRPTGWQPRSFSETLKSAALPPGVMGLLDTMSPVRKSWAGCNASTFRENVLKVNGFDERMAYGGQDKEFGARLINAGISGRHLRYSAPLYHLEHARGYVDSRVQQKNRQMIVETRKTGRSWTEYGIVK